MAEKEFRPGDAIPDSGVYVVVHQKHRPDHEAVLVAGNRFPVCGRCGDGVRFRLVRDAASLDQDGDFR